MIHRQSAELIAELFSHGLQGPDRFFAVCGVMVHEVNLLTFQAVKTAFLVSDVLNQRCRLTPISRGEVEHPWKHLPVGRGRSTVAHRKDRNLIHCGLGNQLIGDARRQGLDRERARGRRVLDLLVALNTFFGVVAGFTVDMLDFDAVDTTITLVEHIQVIGKSVGDRNTVRRIGAGTVIQRWNHQFVGIGT